MSTMEELTRLRAQLDADRATNIGYPGAVDFDYTELLPFFNDLLNNVGDPYAECTGRAHTKQFEREVVGFVADLLRASPSDRWGYVTTGGTEGNEYGLHLARSWHPDAVVYFSAAAHYGLPKLAERLRMPAVVVPTTGTGEMSYLDLRIALDRHPSRPAVVVATAGTTMTEAVDDVARIRQTLHSAGMRAAFVHVDAALAGIPLALLGSGRRPAFDLADGADSITVSGHKFLGSPFPCGVVVTRQSLRDRMSRPVEYIGSVDATVGGSRSGHAPLVLWYALRRHGRSGLHERAERSRRLAGYAVTRLRGIGIPAWRNRLAFTVVLPTPPERVVRRWALASEGGVSHLVCMPGIDESQLDAFVADVAASSGEPGRLRTEVSRRS